MVGPFASLRNYKSLVMWGCAILITVYTMVWVNYDQRVREEQLRDFEITIAQFKRSSMQAEESIRQALLVTQTNIEWLNQHTGSVLSQVKSRIDAGEDPRTLPSNVWNQAANEAVKNPEEWAKMLAEKKVNVAWERERARKGYVPIEALGTKNLRLTSVPAALGPNANVANAGDVGMPTALHALGADSQCIRLTRDWWTYEVCGRRSVRQYHPGDASFNLGTFVRASIEPRGQTYVELYAGGDACADASLVTGPAGTPQQRQTEVRWECGTVPYHPPNGDASVAPEPVTPTSLAAGILEIQELRSCAYVIIVRTDKLCAGIRR